ncbi:hypothetical protein C8J35_103497 [Rhizobium sp. PP-F2F-G38]|nr:hypothetical protein C8J35_103497 [Rhizobium sp. PP-F2F-G38]
MSDLHTQMVTACGVSAALLHAAQVLVDKALGTESDKNYVAITTLIEEIKFQVDTLGGLADDVQDRERQFAPPRREPHSLPPESAAMGEAFQPHQSGDGRLTASIRDLFALWEVQNRQAVDESLPQAEMGKASDAASVLAEQIGAIVPETAQDFAMKFVAATLTGSLCPPDSFIEEAMRLSGYAREGA